MDKDIKNLIVDSFSPLTGLAANTQASLRKLRRDIWSQSEQRSTIYCVSNRVAIVDLATKVFNTATVKTTIKV